MAGPANRPESRAAPAPQGFAMPVLEDVESVQVALVAWQGRRGDTSPYADKESRRSGAKIRHAPTNYLWAYEMQGEDIEGNALRLGSDSKENEPAGEWLDMQGQALGSNSGGRVEACRVAFSRRPRLVSAASHPTLQRTQGWGTDLSGTEGRDQKPEPPALVAEIEILQ